MTLLTPTFLLPYPSATDAPCDFAEQWCEFTAAVENVLGTFEAAVVRTVPLIPVAQMILTAPSTSSVNQPVVFDTVKANTVSWVDFDQDQTTIRVNRAGRFVVTGTATVTTSGSVNSSMILTIEGSKDSALDRGDVEVGVNLSQLFSIATTTDFQMTVHNSNSASTPLVVQHASLTVYWHADGASP